MSVISVFLPPLSDQAAVKDEKHESGSEDGNTREQVRDLFGLVAVQFCLRDTQDDGQGEGGLADRLFTFCRVVVGGASASSI
jgi:hypothetical protein